MKNFPRFLATISAFCALSTAILAQSIEKRINDDSYFGASVYRPYVFPEIKDTPAPKGFKPFYISHFGRHGSRHQADNNATRAYTILKKADKAGILSPRGKELYADISTLVEDHEGQMGHLSPKGAAEHRTLARRMKARFPSVFKSKKRTHVFCQSSVYPRCLMSMTNFTTALQEEAPKLDFEFVTGERYMDILAHDFYNSKEIFSSDEIMYDSLLRVYLDPEPIMKRFFIDNDAAVKPVITDTTRLLKGLYTISAICDCIDYMGINLFDKYFTKEEIVGMYIPYNNRICGNYGNTIEFGDRCNWAAKWLLEDFVLRADKALENGSPMAADLRFAHDTGVMPLVALMGLEGFDKKFPRAEAHKYFDTAVHMTMATNFQMIFYRNKKGEVLVKMLYNEKEITIPALPSFSGPYYSWPALRAYLEPLFIDKTPPAVG